MFTWLGNRLGEWVDRQEELFCRENPNVIYSGSRWLLWGGLGFLFDFFLCYALFMWFRLGMPL